MCQVKNKKKYYIPAKPGNFGRPRDAVRRTNKVTPENKKKKSTSFHRIIDICVQNVNSIQSENRNMETKIGIKDSKSDIILLTETKLGADSNDFQVPGYKIVCQKDRKKGAGGIMILAKENIIVSEAEASDVVDEIQVASFKIGELLIIGVYRSPSIALGSTNKIHHGGLIKHLNEKIEKQGKSPYVVTGDFNLGELARVDFKPPNLTEPEEGDELTVNQMWAEWYSYHDLRQYVNVPTFQRSDNTLDLCFTPMDQDIATLRVTDSTFGSSFDHKTLLFGIPMDYETTEEPVYRRISTLETWYNFREELKSRKLYEGIQRLVAMTYPHHGFENKEDCVSEYLTRNIREAYECTTPEVLVKTPSVEGYLTKETVQLIRLSKRRYATLKWAKENNLWSDEKMQIKKRNLKTIKTAIAFQMNRDRLTNEMRTLQISEKKADNFYKFMGKITKKQTSKNNAVRDQKEVLQTKNVDIANTFNRYLGSTLEGGEQIKIVWETVEYTMTPEGPLKLTRPSIHPDGPNDVLSQIWITPETVIYEIRKAKKDSAPGPDNLPMNVFAEAAGILSGPLAALYNMVQQSGNVPKSWKSTKVVMLHKKKSKDDVKNYRPLSMSNHLGKIWERILNSALKDHLEKHGLLDSRQHGFRSNMGTQTNLLQMWEETVSKLEKDGALVEVWSFDLTKAFDLLDHNKVLQLLKKSGVTGMVGKCIQDWLSGRSQYVQTGQDKSEKVPVNKSCVQGSVLGPTLWLVYIQSLLDRLKKTGISYYGYADDITIVKTLKNETEKAEFEGVLKIIEEWADEFGMIWSPTKTQRLVLEYKGCKMPHDPYKIVFGGQEIVPLEATAETLGLLLSKNCYFGAHIKRIVDRLRSITSKVRRNFVSRDPAIMQKIYSTYMQPRIDYVSIVYNPGLESLLKSVTKAASSFWSLCSSGTPEDKFMEPRLRLIVNDLVFFHKMAKGKSVLDFQTMFKQPSPLSREEMMKKAYLRKKKLRIPKWRLKLSRLRFSFRVRPYWNLLPIEIQILEEKEFKIRLKEFILANKTKFLNLGLKDYNIVGEEYVKEIKNSDKKGPIGLNKRKYKKWNKPLKNTDISKAEKVKKTAKKPISDYYQIQILAGDAKAENVQTKTNSAPSV